MFYRLKPFITFFLFVSLLGCVNSNSTSDVNVNTATIVVTTTFTPDSIKTLQPFTSTPVPLGVFAVLFYPPLAMKYDVSEWDDKSEYSNRSVIINYLQAKKLSACRLGVQGATGFYEPYEAEDIVLGNVHYTALTLPDSFSSDYVFLFYLEGKSLSDYNYELYGLPVFGIGSTPSEWEECKKLGEEVLSTLHVP